MRAILKIAPRFGHNSTAPHTRQNRRNTQHVDPNPYQTPNPEPIPLPPYPRFLQIIQEKVLPNRYVCARGKQTKSALNDSQRECAPDLVSQILPFFGGNEHDHIHTPSSPPPFTFRGSAKEVCMVLVERLGSKRGETLIAAHRLRVTLLLGRAEVGVRQWHAAAAAAAAPPQRARLRARAVRCLGRQPWTSVLAKDAWGGGQREPTRPKKQKNEAFMTLLPTTKITSSSVIGLPGRRRCPWAQTCGEPGRVPHHTQQEWSQKIHCTIPPSRALNHMLLLQATFIVPSACRAPSRREPGINYDRQRPESAHRQNLSPNPRARRGVRYGCAGANKLLAVTRPSPAWFIHGVLLL